MPTLESIAFDHPLRLAWAAPLLLLLFYYVLRGGFDRRKVRFLIVRTVLICLLVVALASPHILTKKEVLGDLPPITIIEDASPSMDLFDSEALGNRLYNEINSVVKNATGKADVNIEFFSGNKTAIGDTLYRTRLKSLEGNQIVILLSDGRNNFGREPVSVAAVLAPMNITVFTISPRVLKDDIRISDVMGDDKTPVNAEYDMVLKVEKTSQERARYTVEITVDGSRIHEETVSQTGLTQYINKTLMFSETGVHEIVINLVPGTDDFFPDNNRFYKKVDVVERPELLVIGSETDTPLLKVLSRIYDVKFTTNVNEEISGYPAVVLDNINSDDLDGDLVEKYKRYVLAGNGIIAVGGDNSYEYGSYNNSYFESLLPVKSGKKPTKERQPIGVVFLMDLSCSFAAPGLGQTEPDEIAKALMINVMRQLDPRDSIGLIAFNVDPYTVVDFTQFEYLDREALEDRILRLQACLLGEAGTDAYSSLDEAERMLSGFEGKKFIFMFTDGEIYRQKNSIDSLYYKLETMADKGIQSNFIGVGGGASVLGSNPDNPIPKSESRMVEFARRGNGLYYGPSEREHERLLLRFSEEEKGDEGFTLKIYDRYHFITEGMELSDVKISNYNTVYEKSISRMVVSTKAEQPVITVWWFGLGRVASITTDNGMEWSPRMYEAGNGKLISALTNWIIGDLEKGRSVLLKTGNAYVGNEALIKVEAQSKPELIVKHSESGIIPEVALKQDSLDSFVGTFNPNRAGLYAVKAILGSDSDVDALAVNYPVELNQLGIDSKTLSSIAGATGGSYYTHQQVSQLEADLLDYARRISTVNRVEETPVWHYLAVAALLMYFADCVLRRVSIILRLKGK
ncbi:MAG: VWA domain-containing protein [Candidatus Altiarchaeota archaeon]